MARYVIETTPLQDELIEAMRGPVDVREFIRLCLDMGFTAALAEYTDTRQAMQGRYLVKATKGFKHAVSALSALPVREAADEVTLPEND